MSVNICINRDKLILHGDNLVLHQLEPKMPVYIGSLFSSTWYQHDIHQLEPRMPVYIGSLFSSTWYQHGAISAHIYGWFSEKVVHDGLLFESS